MKYLELDITEYFDYLLTYYNALSLFVGKYHRHLLEEVLLHLVHDLNGAVKAAERGVDGAIHDLVELAGVFGLLGACLVVPACYFVLILVGNGVRLEQLPLLPTGILRILFVKLQFLHALTDLAFKSIIERDVIVKIRLRDLNLAKFSPVGVVKVIVVGLSAI